MLALVLIACSAVLFKRLDSKASLPQLLQTEHQHAKVFLRLEFILLTCPTCSRMLAECGSVQAPVSLDTTSQLAAANLLASAVEEPLSTVSRRSAALSDEERTRLLALSLLSHRCLLECSNSLVDWDRSYGTSWFAFSGKKDFTTCIHSWSSLFLRQSKPTMIKSHFHNHCR